MPPAVCLNPHRPDCNYPFKDLCAAGVAFILVAGLRRELRSQGHFENKSEPDVRTLLDIVAVATVADGSDLRKQPSFGFADYDKWLDQLGQD